MWSIIWKAKDRLCASLLCGLLSERLRTDFVPVFCVVYYLKGKGQRSWCHSLLCERNRTTLYAMSEQRYLCDWMHSNTTRPLKQKINIPPHPPTQPLRTPYPNTKTGSDRHLPTSVCMLNIFLIITVNWNNLLSPSNKQPATFELFKTPSHTLQKCYSHSPKYACC